MSSEYAFRVRGGSALTPSWHSSPSRRVDAAIETVLRGTVTDQAALHGLIA